ncbi:MAG: GTPase Era [Anaerolineae bacterium]|nr:GTPase Era [Anaerolineae bacterium]
MTDQNTAFDTPLPADHRSGVVAVVGRPNVGKSTLINHLLKQKIAIVSPKPQTTRRRQLGIYTDARGQILFVDTPGLHAPQHKLGEYMVKMAESAFRDADVILLLLDVSQQPERADQYIAETVARLRGDTPVLLALNKADLLTPENREANTTTHTALIPHEQAYTISALNGDGVAALLNDIMSRLPTGPLYYPPDEVSDMNMRFIAAEVVREKIMLLTEQEIPYSVAVEVDSYKERSDDMTYISALIYVERDSQKGIVIGKGGEMIKKISTQARTELADMLGTKVFLDLRVKVLKNWRSDEKLMQRLGYRMRDEE